MRRLGRVDLISHNGCLLVRGDFAPQEGSGVLDRSGRELGTIFRVFGPVASPYVSIQPSKEFRRSMVGSIGLEVFVDDVGLAEGVRRRSLKRRG
jgi:rRNA processing protein Gar1